MRQLTLRSLVLVWLVPIWLCLGLLAPVAPAFAEGGSADEGKRKNKARKLLENAAKQKRIGDRQAKRKRSKQARASYRKAAIGYRDAYRLTEAPAILQELGVVYQARGELTFARHVYRKYLELQPEGEAADVARAALEAVESEIAEIEMTDAEPEPGDPELDPTDIIGPEPVHAAKDAAKDEPADESEDESEDEAGAGSDDGPVDLVTPTPGKKSLSVLEWSGVGAGATGVALVGLGVFFGLDARSKSNTLSNKEDPWTPADRELIASGQSSETKMYIFTSVGAALVVGGAVLFYRGMTQRRARASDEAATAVRSPSIMPVVTPESATITFSGHF